MTEWEKYERMVSLRSEKVELAVIDDLLKNGELINKTVPVLTKDLSDLKDAISKINFIKANLKQDEELNNKVIDLVIQFEKKVQELGLDLPASVKQISSSTTRVQKLIQEIKSLI